MPTSIEALWGEFHAAEAALVTFGPTSEQLREEAAEAERLARENGTPAKSLKVIETLLHRWKTFLEVHGCAYGFKEDEGPTIELAVHFQVRLSAVCTAANAVVRWRRAIVWACWDPFVCR